MVTNIFPHFSSNDKHMHTHPAESRDSQGNTGLELIWILLAQTGDERDGCSHHALSTERQKFRKNILTRIA